MGPGGMHRHLSRSKAASAAFSHSPPASRSAEPGPQGDVVASFTIREADRAGSAKQMAGAKPRGPKARARGADAAERPPGPIRKGEWRRASPCCVKLGSRSTR